MEELELTDPVVIPEEVTNKYKIVSMVLDIESVVNIIGEPGQVVINLKDNLGKPFTHQYVGKAAVDMIKWMNTANFTVNSMNKKVLQKLSNDGVLPGTVTGTPDPPPADF